MEATRISLIYKRFEELGWDNGGWVFGDRVEGVTVTEDLSKGAGLRVEIDVKVGDSIMNLKMMGLILGGDSLNKVGVEDVGVLGNVGRGELKGEGGVEFGDESGCQF